MSPNIYKRNLILFTSAASIALIAKPASAQTLPDSNSSADPASISAPDPGDADKASPDIVVTGSRISRRDYAADSPIISLSPDSLGNTGQSTVERALSNLPQFTGSFGQ